MSSTIYDIYHVLGLGLGQKIAIDRQIAVMVGSSVSFVR